VAVDNNFFIVTVGDKVSKRRMSNISKKTDLKFHSKYFVHDGDRDFIESNRLKQTINNYVQPQYGLGRYRELFDARLAVFYEELRQGHTTNFVFPPPTGYQPNFDGERSIWALGGCRRPTRSWKYTSRSIQVASL